MTDRTRDTKASGKDRGQLQGRPQHPPQTTFLPSGLWEKSCFSAHLQRKKNHENSSHAGRQGGSSLSGTAAWRRRWGRTGSWSCLRDRGPHPADTAPGDSAHRGFLSSLIPERELRTSRCLQIPSARLAGPISAGSVYFGGVAIVTWYLRNSAGCQALSEPRRAGEKEALPGTTQGLCPRTQNLQCGDDNGTEHRRGAAGLQEPSSQGDACGHSPGHARCAEQTAQTPPTQPL